MTYFIIYQLISFIRSLKFIPPTIFFLTSIFILYAYNNAPILSSYGVSSISLYLVMTWITMTIFTLEEESEKHILMTQLGRKIKFLVGKWMACLVFMVPLLLFAFFFPIVTDSFKGNLSIESSVFAIYSHIAFSVFGISVGTLFTATILAMKKYAWLSAMLVLVLSLAAKSLIESFSLFKTIDWILPPVYKIIEHMLDGEFIVLKETLLFNISFVLIYMIAATGITMFLFKKKER